MATPYGIRARLPCIDVGEGTDLILADIFCHSTHRVVQEGNRIYLVLQRLNVTANEDPEGYSYYDCQCLRVVVEYTDENFGTRLLHITEAENAPGNHGTSSAQWRDIYISARP